MLEGNQIALFSTEIKMFSRRFLISFAIAAMGISSPQTAQARRPFFRSSSPSQSYNRPQNSMPAMQSVPSSRSIPTATLNDEAEMTRRFGPSILEVESEAKTVSQNG
jgi:hypothetical protein